MKNSVRESRHVGLSIIHFKSIYFHVVNSLIFQIHAHMQIFDRHFEYLYIYIYIYIYISQIELEIGIESQ